MSENNAVTGEMMKHAKHIGQAAQIGAFKRIKVMDAYGHECATLENNCVFVPGDYKLELTPNDGGLQQFGDYVAFDHEPTDKEKSQAVKDLLLKMAPYFEENAIYKEPKSPATGKWTLGIKFYGYKH